MNLERIDHIVLTVADTEATSVFYARLGMKIVYADGRSAMHFGEQKINLHQHGKEFAPHAETPTPGSADLCLIVSTPFDQVEAELRNLKIPIEEGPVERSGANGTIRSLYIRDPDRNLVELAQYKQS